MLSKQNKGYLGEFLAFQFYRNKGYKLLARNYKTKYSEVDLLMLYQNTTHLIEVKLTTNSSYNTFKKWKSTQLSKLYKSLKFLQMLNPYHHFQIDYLEFDFSKPEVVRIKHYQNISPPSYFRQKI